MSEPPAPRPAPVDDVARLYASAPEDFVSERKALAARLKAEGRAEDAAAVLALRKPTAAAWAVNLLAASHPDDVRRLIEVGARLREAQERLDGAAMRESGAQRRAVVAELVAAGVAEVSARGRSVSAAVRAQIEQTLSAAVADPDVAEAVGSGRLVAAGEPASGLGTVSPSGSAGRVGSTTVGPVVGGAAPVEPVAQASRAVASGATASDARRRAAAERAAAERRARRARAESAVREARSAADAATAALDDARAQARRAQERVAEAAARLEEAEREALAARAAATDAATRHRRARAALAEAERRLAAPAAEGGEGAG